MATTLYLVNVPDVPERTAPGLAYTCLDSTSGSYFRQSLDTSRGATAVSAMATTVTGPTPGIELVYSTSAPRLWISPPLAAGATISGNITFNIWAYEDNRKANAAINARVFRVSGQTGVFTEIIATTRSTELDTTAVAVNWSEAPTSTAFARGDRIAVVLHADDAGTMASGYTVYAYYNGPTADASGDTYLTFNETLSFESAPSGTTIYPTTSGVSFAAPSLLTDFTGSNENPLSDGGNWALLGLQSYPLKRVSNAVTASTPSAGNGSYWTADSAIGPDLEAYVTLATLSGTNYIYARLQNPSSSSASGYSVGQLGSTWWIHRWDSGSSTQLVTNTSPTVVSGDKLGIACRGDSIEAWMYDASASAWLLIARATDSTYSAAGSVALGMTSDSGVLDDFYVGEDTNVFSTGLEAWTSRGSGVTTAVTNTVNGPTIPILITGSSTGGPVEWYTKPLAACTLEGAVLVNQRDAQSNFAANVVFACEIARTDADGTNATVWGTSWAAGGSGSCPYTEGTTSEAAVQYWVAGPSLSISAGQRLRIRFYIDDAYGNGPNGGAQNTGYTATLWYAGTSGGASGDTYLTFPITLTESGPLVSPTGITSAGAFGTPSIINTLRPTSISAPVGAVTLKSESPFSTTYPSSWGTDTTSHAWAEEIGLAAANPENVAYSVGGGWARFDAVDTQSASAGCQVLWDNTDLRFRDLELLTTLSLADDSVDTTVSGIVFYRGGPSASYHYLLINSGLFDWGHGDSDTVYPLVTNTSIVNWSISTPIQVRIKCIGTSHYIKVWCGTEPGSWTLEQTYSGAPELAGGIGFGYNNASLIGSTAWVAVDSVSLWSLEEAAVSTPTVVLGEPPSEGILRPTGIASAEAFGTAAITRGGVTVLPTGIASAGAYGSAVVRTSARITTTGIGSLETVSAPTIIKGAVTVLPTGIVSAAAYGTATVLRGNVTVAVTATGTSEAFGTAVCISVAKILPSAVDSVEAFGTADVSQPAGPLNIQTSAIDTTGAFGTTSVIRGGVTVLPTGIASSEAIGTAVRTSFAKILPSGIVTAEVLGTATILRGTARIIPTGISTAANYGTATLLPGGVTISVSSIASVEAFGTTVVAEGVPPAQTITPDALASTEALGTATLLCGGVSIQPTAISSTEAVVSPAIRASAKILPTAIASAQVLGTPTLVVGGVAIQPSAVASGEAFGTAYVNAGQMLFAPVSIASAGAFGTANVRPGGRTITVTGIATAQVLGTPVLAKTSTITTTGIASGQQTGVPVVIRGAVSIVTTGATTGEALGTPTIATGPGLIVPSAVSTAEALGNPIVEVGVIPGTTVEPTGTLSTEAFGTPIVRAGMVRAIVSGIGTAAVVPNPVLYGHKDLTVSGITTAELFGLPVVAKGPAYIRPSGLQSEEVVPPVALANLLDSWLWVNRSPGFIDTQTGGFPVLQSGLYGTRRQEGEG